MRKTPGQGQTRHKEELPGEDSHLDDLQSRIGYRFQDPDLLLRALTHRSYVHEQAASGIDPKGDYEALEFLGDALLGFLISDALLQAFPQSGEGELSKRRSILVARPHLSKLSRRLGLGSCLRLSRGEEKTGGRSKAAILADIFESLTAALYLDGGLETARRFVLSQFQDSLEEMQRGEIPLRDSKSALQEILQRRGASLPTYAVLQQAGPDHQKVFQVQVRVDGEVLAQGCGPSKKQAEQEAAFRALQKLELAPGPHGTGPKDQQGHDVK